MGKAGAIDMEVTPLVPVSISTEENQQGLEDNIGKEGKISKLLSWTSVRILALIAAWYFFSTVLSLFNKKLLGKEHGIFGHAGFPAPLMMTSFQFLCQYFLARMCLDIGIIKRNSTRVGNRTWEEYARTVLPNGMSTGLDIGFSNMSLQTITLSFYVMCKSTTPMFLLMFAFIWKLERPSWSLGGVVVTISCGILLLVYGETKFNLLGFVLVMFAACLAGLRWTLTQILLQGNKKEASHGGPLEVLQQLTPVMSLTVFLVACLVEHPLSLRNSTYFMTWQHTMITVLLIFFSAGLAFVMVWTEFKVIKETSALTFMVAGTCKEVVTVLAAVIFFGEDFGPINAAGLFILITGVSLYNLYKYKKVKEGVVKCAPRRRQKGEQLHRDALGYVELQEQDLEMLNNAENVGEITAPHHRPNHSNLKNAEVVEDATSIAS